MYMISNISRWSIQEKNAGLPLLLRNNDVKNVMDNQNNEASTEFLKTGRVVIS